MSVVDGVTTNPTDLAREDGDPGAARAGMVGAVAGGGNPGDCLLYNVERARGGSCGVPAGGPLIKKKLQSRLATWFSAELRSETLCFK